MPIVEIDDLETRSTEGSTGDIVLEIDGVDRGSPGWDIGDLQDVLITSVANNDSLVWNSTSGKWVNGATLTTHALTGAYHTASGLTTGHFLKATGSTAFGFAAHGLTYSDVGAVQAISSTANRLARFAGTNGQVSDSSMREDASGNVTVTGNLTVQGQSFQADHIIQTASTFVLVNNGETGAGVTNTRSGIEIDRGSLYPYRFQMHETTDDLRIGQFYVSLPYTGLTGTFQAFEKVTGGTSGAIGWIITDNGSTMTLRGTATAFTNGETITGAASAATATAGTQTTTDSTQAVATRQDSPASAGIAYWNSGQNRFDTSADVTISNNGISTHQVTLATSPSVTPVVGTIYWDSTEGVPSVMLSASTTMSIGTEIYVRCVNKTGVQIDDGSVVYINGAQGNRPTIALARADAVLSSSVIGVATQNIADNAEGFVTISGDVHGYNTSGFADGDRLYLSATNAGQLTKTAPSSPNFVVVVATALNSTNNGTICVHPRSSIAGNTSLGSSNIVAPTQLAVKTYVDTAVSTAASSVLLAPASSTRNVIQPTGDYTALIVKYNASQTSNPFEIQNSSGTAMLAWKTTGLFTDRWATASDTNTVLGISAAGANGMSHSTGTTGWYNTVIGNLAGNAITEGAQNLFMGYSAGKSNTVGVQNVCLGAGAGENSIDGSGMCAVGYQAAYNARSGTYSGTTAIGYLAARQGTTVSIVGTTAVGYRALTVITTGAANNTALGYDSGVAVTTGTNNLLLGYKVGDNLTTGSGNIIIGYDLDASAVGVSNELNIGGLIKGNITGVTTTAQIYAPDGAVGTPSYSFQSDPNTGLYWVSADKIGISTGGVLRATVDSTGVSAVASFIAPLYQTADNAATLTVNLPVTGTDNGGHTVALQLDGNTLISGTATGNGAGAVGARAITVGTSGDSISLAGTTTAATAASGTNTTQVATTAFAVSESIKAAIVLG